MELVGTACTLRPWRRGDEESLVKYANNWNVSRNLHDHFPYPYTMEDANRWRNAQLEFEVPRPTNFAIAVDDETVGGTGFDRLAGNYHITAGAGYWL